MKAAHDTAGTPRWRRDLWCIGAGVVAWLAVASALDLHESFVVWAVHFERWQLDEMPFTAIVLTSGLAWFALRRCNELRAELARRQAAEAQAAALLAHNRELTRQLITATEAERLAIARELHDEMGQHCSAVLIETASLRRCAADDRGAMLGAAARADVAAQSLYMLLRGLLSRLRPPQLDALGLLAALQDLCEGWELRSGVACVLHHDGRESQGGGPGGPQLPPLSDACSVTVYRVVQESLTNVLRHAGASSVRVRLTQEPAAAGLLTVTVQDDGRGMDTAAGTRRGLGLLGAAERAASVGGQLQLHSAPGAGLRLVLQVPLADSSAAWRAAA